MVEEFTVVRTGWGHWGWSVVGPGYRIDRLTETEARRVADAENAELNEGEENN